MTDATENMKNPEEEVLKTEEKSVVENKPRARRAAVKKVAPEEIGAEENETSAEPEKEAEKTPKKSKTLPTDAVLPEESELGESREVIRHRKRSVISEFARGEDVVLGVDGQERRSEKVEEFATALTELTMSMKSGRVMHGRLQGVERKYHDGKPVIVGVVYYHGFKILIGAEDILGSLYTRNLDMTEANSLVFALNSRLGSFVSFIITDIIPEARQCSANHSKAAAARRRQFFMREDPATGKPRVYPGRVVEAKVLAVRRYGILMDIFGFETYQPLTALTYIRTDHSGQLFQAGESIEVLIKDIEYENNDVKSVTISVKELKSNPVRKAMEACSQGSCYTGEIVMMDENAVFVSIIVDDQKLTCYCNYPNFGGIRKGSECVVLVHGKDLDLNRIWGRILRVTRF